MKTDVINSGFIRCCDLKLQFYEQLVQTGRGRCGRGCDWSVSGLILSNGERAGDWSGPASCLKLHVCTVESVGVFSV